MMLFVTCNVKNLTVQTKPLMLYLCNSNTGCSNNKSVSNNITMSKLSLNIPHAQTQEEALNRIKQLLSRLQEEQKGAVSKVQEIWDGPNGSFSFSAKGFHIAGTIQVKENEVQLDSDLPFAVSFFKGQIASMITQRANDLLA